METTIKELKNKIEEAIELASESMTCDGAHHKVWYMDQIVRLLAGDRYPEIVKATNINEDGEDIDAWDIGIEP